MKEYIIKEHPDFPYEKPKPPELIRCKDFVWYGGDDEWSTCAITPEYLVPPNGYCHRAEPKETS